MMSNTTPLGSPEKGDGGMEMSVLEMQRAMFKWQQEQLQMPQFSQHLQHLQQLQQESYFSDFSVLALQAQQGFHGGLLVDSGDTVLNELISTRPVRANPGMDPGFACGWPEHGFAASNTTITTTNTVDCSGGDLSVGQVNSSGYGHGVLDKLGMAAGKMNFNKRKADNKTLQILEVEAEDESRAKKVKGYCEEEEFARKKVDHQQNSNSGDSSSSKNDKKESKTKEGSGSTLKGNTKISEVQKTDYIRVRARPGQATDSHSLAERVRREKISERMKYLQGLVPGCNKITGKAGMLDETINYVQSLQQQVEFLSMKLAAVFPRLDFNIEDFLPKEVVPACSSNFPAMGVSSEMANVAHLQCNPGQQMGQAFGSHSGMSQPEMGFRQTITSSVSIPQTPLESSCVTQQIQSCLPWDQSDIYNMVFQQAREESFP